MDCPPNAEVLAIVSSANQQWLWDGRTHKAAALYEKAARLSAADPVILFQSARAQWALGRVDAARATLNTARSRTRHLSGLGLDRLTKFERQLANGPRAKLPRQLQSDDLDVDRLEQVSLSPSEWSALADAAEERGVYGVAFFARGRAKGPITVIDEEKEEWELVKRAESELTLLDAMRECNHGAG